MALNPSFSVSQDSGSPNIISATDTSTGSDSNVTKRRIFLLQADGTYLVPEGTTTDFVEWSLASTTINLDVLTGNAALQITTQWLNVSNTVLYTVTSPFSFTNYGEAFYYNLTQQQSTNPEIIASLNFYETKMMVRVELDSAAQAITFAGDIKSSQQCLDRLQVIINNQNFFF